MALDIFGYSLRYDQSPGGSRIFSLSSLAGESRSDLESVGFDVDSAHPGRWPKHDRKSRVAFEAEYGRSR